MLTSMTGFARTEGHGDGANWSWELRSVNGKGLDMRVRMPPGWESLDPDLRAAISKTFQRGTIHVALDVVTDASRLRPVIDKALLKELWQDVAETSASFGLPPPRLESLLAIKGVIESGQDARTPAASSEHRDAMLASFHQALAALAAARAGEGAALQKLLLERVALVSQLVGQARGEPSRQPDAIRTRLRAQVMALVESSEALDPARLHQEAVLLAVKADVAEELDRLDSHVEQASALIAGAEPSGRRLDFLSQEMAREANTLCAKANHVAISRIGLDLKTLIEQFREQVQNVQ
jgi:uncharacterized protein (TIGR00255 family)